MGVTVVVVAAAAAAAVAMVAGLAVAAPMLWMLCWVQQGHVTMHSPVRRLLLAG